MILDEVSWMNIRRFRSLHEAGASYVEIAAEVGCDWRTVKKYLTAEPTDPQAAVPPRAPSRAGTQPRLSSRTWSGSRPGCVRTSS